MANKYRVKEVKAILPVDGEDYFIFYPQIEVEVEEKTGHLWWKKTARKKEWHNFYMFADYILTEDKEKDSIESLIKSGCVSFNTKEKAEAFFEKYNEQQRNATIRWNKIIAEGTDDGSKDVTIHEFSE